MRQLRLIPSGCQVWYRDTIAASDECFAYSSTMALHIYRLKDNRLYKMIAAADRAISSICWSPNDSNLLACCSVSGRVAIWDLENEDERYSCKVSELPQLMDWSSSGDKIVLALETGEIRLWEYEAPAEKQAQTKLFSVNANGAKVLRWHPRVASKLLVGTADGAVIIYDHQTGKKAQITGKAKTSKDPVSDAQWDPLSDDYLLVAFGDGSLTLFDAGTQREVHSFDRQTQGIKSLAWAKAQPGNFITATEKVGVLRLWNVSQRSPLTQIKVGSAGVNCVKAIPSEPNWFVLSFKNNSIGVCDIATRTMRYMSCPGHSETIFGTVFHPEDPDILATASYDGYVKLWRISTMESHREMCAGKDQLLYGLAFGPGATRLCAVSHTGYLFIWRTDTGEQLLRQNVHNGQQAYRVEWNQRGRPEGTGEIVSGGADGFACVVDAATGDMIHRIAHPGSVIGVTWHPTQDGILATACQDGIVRLFNLMERHSGEPKPFVLLQGHEARVFNLAFNPICPDIIASGSDDKTIRVWNWRTGREVRKLAGHTAYVRGLLWHSELPGILFSGSWDATIRIWDVINQRCIHTSHEHHADVYALTLHPRRPFFLVSSSRDTTLRFWVFEDLVRPLLAQTLVHVKSGRLTEICGVPEEAQKLIEEPHSTFVVDREEKLYGHASRALVASVRGLQDAKPGSIEVYRDLVSFFMWRQGIDDLWGLLAMARGETLPSAMSSARRSVFHEKELIACQKSKALELASARATMTIAGKQEERLLKAAQIMLRVGDLRAYCRFTAQAGQWERAICIAPAVGQQFWQELCSEYIDTLSATTELEESAPFWVATGQAQRLVDTYIDRGELDNAFAVAKANADNLMPGVRSRTGPTPPPPPPPEDGRERLEDVAGVLASRYLQLGEPVQAALCYLAVSKPAAAAAALSSAHEVILAYIVAELTGEEQDPTLLKLLGQCAERDSRWEVAESFLRQHPQGESTHLPLLAARCPDKALAQRFSGRGPEQHRERMQEALAAGDRANAVLHAVCAGENDLAATVGVEGLYALFGSNDGFGGSDIAAARALLDPLESLPLQDMSVHHIANILSCAAYVGLVEASTLNYHELMFPLAQTLRNIITHQNLPFPVSLAEITILEATSTAKRTPGHAMQQLNGLLADPELPQHLRQVVLQHVASIESGNFESSPGLGLSKLAGGFMPTCYKRFAKTSVLSNRLIKGPAFELEDHKMHVSLADALAWVRVNAFSPLNTGCKIFPV